VEALIAEIEDASAEELDAIVQVVRRRRVCIL
jgi:hypothetical protein